VADFIAGFLGTKLKQSVIGCSKKVGNLWRPFNENYEPLIKLK